MNIKDFDLYKKNEKVIGYLINKYADLPITKTIKGTRIILTNAQKDVVTKLKSVCDVYETEIEANEENTFIYCILEHLCNDSVTL